MLGKCSQLQVRFSMNFSSPCHVFSTKALELSSQNYSTPPPLTHKPTCKLLKNEISGRGCYHCLYSLARFGSFSNETLKKWEGFKILRLFSALVVPHLKAKNLMQPFWGSTFLRPMISSTSDASSSSRSAFSKVLNSSSLVSDSAKGQTWCSNKEKFV